MAAGVVGGLGNRASRDKLPSSPYGAAAVITFQGDPYAFNTVAGAILLKTPTSAGSNAPVTIDGDNLLAGARVPLSLAQHPLIIAYRLGAEGKLPDTVGS